MIRIRSSKEGFRRCGIAHSKKPVDYPNDKFTEEQLKALNAEPMLFVEVIPDPPPPEDKGKKEEEGKKENADPSAVKAKEGSGKK